MTSEYFNNPKEIEAAKQVIFDRIYWDRLDNGTITDEEITEEIKKRLPDTYFERAISVYNNWFRLLSPIEGMSELLDDIKSAGKKLYLLSNISKGFADNYKSVLQIKEVLDKFDGIVLSAPIHLTKPGVGIYKYLLQKYDLKATDCTFIDDSLDNISTAKRLGINVFHFTGDTNELSGYILKN